MTDDLAHDLRRTRLARSLTLKQAAKQLGVCYQTVHRWETGFIRLRGSSRRLVQLWINEEAHR